LRFIAILGGTSVFCAMLGMLVAPISGRLRKGLIKQLGAGHDQGDGLCLVSLS
jgi:hypothetical protein